MARRIDAGLARKTVALLRAQGLPAEAVLARAGLDTATLSRKGARIPFAGHVALLEHAAAAARDPCFGLHLGAALHPRDLGLVGYLGANAATLGDVLYVAGKYLPLLTEGTRVEVVATGERVRVEQHLLDPAGAGSRQVAGLGASSLVRVARLLTGTMLAPAWIELPFDSCDDEAEHRRVLGAPVRTGQPRTAVVLEQRQLALRAVGAEFRPVRSPGAGLPRAGGSAARPAGSPRSGGERDHRALTLQHALSRPRGPPPRHE